MRRAILGAIVTAGLAGPFGLSAQEPAGHAPPAIIHHHEHEGRDPLLPFHGPETNAGRMRRGEGPINERTFVPRDLENTGHPEQIAPWAVPVRTSPYYGYYVGGGTGVAKGEPRCAAAEGTFGWDYTGGLFPRRVALLWSHGRKVQNNEGRYRNTYPIEYRNPLFRLESPHLYHESTGAEPPAIEAGSR